MTKHLSEFLHMTPGDCKCDGVRRDADGQSNADDINAAAGYTTMIRISPHAGLDQ
ncbi:MULTISPECIES: hypothetical protein [unclassified Mycobacterium]|uniref:hypothetical protein n=1 Tax=unclassified Mycobacterium TaxID=2642494 RepID=UPI0029C75644|nr:MULTISPECIES: hypothetical protein [unclassified Mycobacterium]